MTEPKKRIEVAMPVKEVSAESVLDKSIRHGHIYTLHLGWARRSFTPVCLGSFLQNASQSAMSHNNSFEAFHLNCEGQLPVRNFF